MTTELPESTEVSDLDTIPTVLRAAFERKGFTALTPVQQAVLAVESGRDLRISSQTGSGKTAAIGLVLAPALLADESSSAARGPAALVITPTRELAEQVKSELDWMFADVANVQVECVTGGTPVGAERRRLTRGRPRILVGTPGRLLDHIGSSTLDCSGITQLVLDEADQMLDMGFRDEIEAICDAMPTERRTHLVSATFPDGVRAWTERYQRDAIGVEGTRLGAVNSDIAHVGYVVHQTERYDALVNLLLLAGEDQRVLVFVATRADTAKLSEQLTTDGFGALPLSGDLAQPQRTRTLAAFRSGSIRVLVATDVAARGIDVPDVSLVIHGDLPMDGEVYTHRSGRTGRAGRKGRSVILATPRAEQRARRILSDAGVGKIAEWQLVPSALDVRRALAKRARRRVQAALEAAAATTFDEAQREFAARLLENRDPVDVVAALVAMQDTAGRCAPRELQTPMPRKARHAAASRAPGEQGIEHGGQPRAPRDTARDGSREFTRFQIDWGFRAGANPSRLLAVICRRGDITSAQVGSIDVDAYSATFEVANDSASEFERRARRPDPRNPEQNIARAERSDRGGFAGGGPAGGGDRRRFEPRPKFRKARQHGFA